MVQQHDSKSEQVARALSIVTECMDILFNYAPVMLHVTDRERGLVDVNRRWLTTLEFERDEVLGKNYGDFLTEESRAWMVQDAAPLFWQFGSARSIGGELVKKNGRVLDVLIDADVLPEITDHKWGYAAARDPHDVLQWQHASTVLNALRQLTIVRHKLESTLSTMGSYGQDTDLPAVEAAVQSNPEVEDLDELHEIIRSISVDMRTLSELEEGRLHERVNQYQVLQLLAETIETMLPILSATLETPQTPT